MTVEEPKNIDYEQIKVQKVNRHYNLSRLIVYFFKVIFLFH